MKKIITLLAILFLSFLTKAYSQNGNIDTVYTPDNVKHINRTCKYPGGQEALMKDIASNFNLPKQAKKDNLKGKIFLQIKIDTLGNADGKILKGLREDVDNAAIEMTKKLKQFIPATMDEKKVPTTLNVPIKL